MKEGHTYMAYPLRVSWLEGCDDAGGTQVAVSVPKRHFKTAVQRNRLKRRIREAYRLHKEEWYARLGDRPVSLMLMYIAKEELPYREIEAGIAKMIRKFSD